MPESFSFYRKEPTRSAYWRSIILLGSNSASYKFALGEALLTFAQNGQVDISATELAEQYAKLICDHLLTNDKQGTSSTSKFLNACRSYNQGEESFDELIAITNKLGFENVLDAFHVVNRENIPLKFFEKKSGNHNGIILTDHVFQLLEQDSLVTLDYELNARWRLVETSWELSLPSSMLRVAYNLDTKNLDVLRNKFRRKNVTPARNSLSGYQKGKCFYCHKNLDLYAEPIQCHVDHLIPHTLQSLTNRNLNLNGIWNLVLACPECNGSAEKWSYLPHIHFLELLERRNNYYIYSKHPLGETILLQTGNTQDKRHRFLQEMYSYASSHILKIWEPERQADLIL